jgi:prephenate dehydrogenase
MARPVVAVAGLGLVGGSLARALSRTGHRVLGLDAPAVLQQARRARAIAGALSGIEEAVAEAEVLVLAAPPRANRRLLRRLARRDTDGLVVTDVGSVKAGIVAEAARLGLRQFVGGHPMAGRETSGFPASSAELFRNHPWILTPAPGARVPEVLRRLVKATGARPFVMDAADHDRTVAYLSHVPQLAAWALFEAARRDPVAGPRAALAGPAFREMTRLAKSPRGLWREILAENRQEVDRALRSFVRSLGRVG